MLLLCFFNQMKTMPFSTLISGLLYFTYYWNPLLTLWDRYQQNVVNTSCLPKVRASLPCFLQLACHKDFSIQPSNKNDSCLKSKQYSLISLKHTSNTVSLTLNTGTHSCSLSEKNILSLRISQSYDQEQLKLLSFLKVSFFR